MRGHWSDAEIDHLKKLQQSFLSAAEMATKLDRTRNMIIGKLKRLGLSPKSVPAHGGYDRVNFGRGPRPKALRTTPFITPPTLKPQPLPAPPPLASDQKEYILGKGKLLLDFDDLPSKPKYCRWPINTPARNEFYLFCGQTVTQGYPYCPHHCRMAYGSGTPSERRATEAA